MAPTVPPPRPPLPDGGIAQRAAGDSRATWAAWYEDELGWATVTAPGEPVLLRAGLHFDVLELPADAGRAVLRRIGPTGPVVLHGRRMRLLVAAGSAEEVPGLLEWLEWGSLPLDLRAIGPGSLITAPAPPGTPPCGPGRPGGAAVWLRPPAPADEMELTLPAFDGFGGAGRGGRRAAPDLVRLLAAAATECHRARLIVNTALSKERQTQPLAFS